MKTINNYHFHPGSSSGGNYGPNGLFNGETINNNYSSTFDCLFGILIASGIYSVSSEYRDKKRLDNEVEINGILNDNNITAISLNNKLIGGEGEILQLVGNDMIYNIKYLEKFFLGLCNREGIKGRLIETIDDIKLILDNKEEKQCFLTFGFYHKNMGHIANRFQNKIIILTCNPIDEYGILYLEKVEKEREIFYKKDII